jgi:MFS family permease
VLVSPVVAAIPSDNPQRDMSFLHSLYAFGVFSMVLISTLFLKIFGTDNWMYLLMILALLPAISAVMFMVSPMPDMSVSHTESVSFEGTKKRSIGLIICIGCIFFGSCAENAMSNWISGYMENALHIDKTVGDILGVAMFAILLGAARFSYAKFGKSIYKVLLIGMIGSAVCYLVAGLSMGVILPFVACILTGLLTAMLWPGTLIMMEENLPGLGVAAYALMAASGDLGASVAPQLLGIVVDSVSVSAFASEMSLKLGLTAEQIGLKAGMLVTAIFPILGTAVIIFAMRYFKKMKKS